MMQATSLSFGLAGRRIADQVSMRIAAGECGVLTGPNGAGKTTLLKTLSGIRRPIAGAVHVHGRDIHACRRIRRKVGALAHEARLYDELTVLENVVFAARLCGQRMPRAQALDLLDKNELGRWAYLRPSSLPWGVIRRASIVRALVHQPAVWLCDEPCAGLDQASVQWFVGILQAHSRNGGCALIATHAPQIWLDFSGPRYHLDQGRLSQIVDDNSKPMAA